MSSNEVRLNIKQRRRSITNRELLIAASEGQLSEVQSTIEAGADINFIDSDGNTALHYAVANDNQDVVELLLRLPVADIICENNANVTALDLARERKVEPIVDMIEKQIWRNAQQIVKVEYPQNAADNTSRNPKTNDNFSEMTFSGNFTVPLQVEDVKNILIFKYFKDKKNLGCGVTTTKDELVQKLKKFKKNPKKCVILASLHNSRWTAIALDFDSDKGIFSAFIEKPGLLYKGVKIESILIDVLKANIIFYEIPFGKYESVRHDSGVNALKLVDIFLGNSNYQQMIQNDWYSFDMKAEKIFLANLLNEKQRTEQKIVACSNILKKLVDCDKNIAKLTHQNINAFVLFLETFALEDTYLSEGDSQLKEIRKIKKEYFSHFYFQPKNEKVDGKPDYRLIIDARASLLHNSRILTVNDCNKFIVKSKLVKDFFKDMSSFTECVCNNVLFADKQVKVIKCSTFLADKNQYKNIGVEDDLEQLGRFMKNLYLTENTVTDENLQEIMYGLIVNIIPLLDNKKEKIGLLGDTRNVLIHNFQKYDSPMEWLREMKRLTFPLKSNLFKYFYAKKVHDVLKKYCLSETTESLDSKICGALKNFEDEVKKITHVASIDDANSFEYLFEESIFPHKDEALDKLVEQYFEFMIIFDRVTELNITLDNDDGDEKESSEVSSDITDLQRREIFEDMVKIKSFMSANVNFTDNKLIDLKSKMILMGIKKPAVDIMFEQIFYQKNNNCKEQTKHQIRLVRDNMLVIKRLITGDLIPIQTLISSYKNNDFAPILESFRDSREKEKMCVEGKFKSLLRGYFKIQLGDEEIQINYVTITIMILNLFYSAFNKYQIKFNNAGEAFKDETFLKYLTSRFGQENEKDELYAHAMLKKLPKIMYTSPFLVYLHETYPNILMDPYETRKLFEIFCKDEFIRPFLEKFIKVADGKSSIVFEEIVSTLLNKEKIDNNVIDVIMQDSKGREQFLNETLKRLKKKPSARVVQLTQMALEIIIAKIKQFIYKHTYSAADKLIEQETVLAIFEAFVEHNNCVVNEFYLYAAKIKNFLGHHEKQIKNADTADQLFQEALIYLGMVSNGGTRHKFLVLSRTSYTRQLMGKYKEALQGYERLYKEIIEFALSESDLPSEHLFASKYYDLVENSIHYMDLLYSSKDDRKYLVLSDIRLSMAYCLTSQNKDQEAIKIYQDLYQYQKSHAKCTTAIPRTLKYIGKVSKNLGKVYRDEKKISQAITHYIDSLVALSKAMTIMKTYYGGIHPVNREICASMSSVVKSIEKCYEE